ncbi:MAG TPA: LamG-like jellyroll fold domain-containing protein, partial [Gillisia sp.]|nr:LamG-like jellyroll fold domain-containing protein [Gillisia sp.]
MITHSTNTHTASFATGALESTFYRVLIQAGTCTEYSTSFYIRALPTGAAPTVENLDPDDLYCLGEEVNLLAKSNYLATQDAISNSSGDFDQGQLNTQDMNSWLVDGNPGGFTAGGNAVKPRNWSGTNNHNFGGIEYDSQDKKFTIAYGNYYEVDKFNNPIYEGNIPTTLESPIMDLTDAETASLDFDQAFYFAINDIAIIEISTDGGLTYQTLRVMHAQGDPVTTWFTAGTAESVAGSTATQYNFNTDNTSISLADYLRETRVRIRWSFTGTSDRSVWAMDNIFVNKKVYVETELEWTEGIGNPEEEPIETGTTEVPITFVPDTPGVHDYGGTALVNGCRTYGEEGTGLITINVSSSYAGEDIIYTSEECGRNKVQLNAYDNTKTANENIEKGAFSTPASGCRKCDAPGTGDIGEWSWAGATPSCTDVSFSPNINDPDAIFTAGPGTYTLTWTVNGCSNDIEVTIANCDKVDFDGTDDYVDFNDNFDLTGAFSLEVWVKPISINGTRTILSKRDSNYSGSALGYDLKIKDGTVSFNWDKSGTLSSSPHKITTNRWYHIALTHSGSGEYRLYIDGIFMKLVAGGSPGDNVNKAILGAMDNNLTGMPVNYFNGWMEELRIWKVALTPEQLRFMMNQHIKKADANKVVGEIIPLNIPNLDWNNLVGYYRMDNIGCGNLLPYNDGTNYIGVNGKLNNITTPQENTAPLPYESNNGGVWHNRNTWDTNSDRYWTFPHDTGINGAHIEWNIAVQNNNIISNNNNIKLLGLFSETETLLEMEGVSNNTGDELRISHYLQLNGIIDLEGESQLIQPEGSIAVGTGHIERDQQGTASSFNYNYWGSPVVQSYGRPDYKVNEVLFDGSTIGTGKWKIIDFGNSYWWADNKDIQSPIKISNYWINTFRKKTANQYSEWERIGSNTAIKIGEGFTMKGTKDVHISEGKLQNYTFKGFPNNGNIYLNGLSTDQNYLIGNPFPSAIDGDQFIKDNASSTSHNSKINFNGVLYFWDHFANKTHILADYIGGYAARVINVGVAAAATDYRINSTGESSTDYFNNQDRIPQRYIPVGQGFFINTVMDPSLGNVTSINPEGILFKNSQRKFALEGTSDSQFLKPEYPTKGKNQEEEEEKSKVIRLNFRSPLGFNRPLAIATDKNATNGFDIGYDAPLNDNFPEDMYWLINSREFVIQGVSNYNLNQEFPLGIHLKEKGEIKIEIGGLENVSQDLNIIIKDSVSNKYHNLRISPFKIELEAGKILGRFALVFEDKTELELPDESEEEEEEEEEEQSSNPGTTKPEPTLPEMVVGIGDPNVFYMDNSRELVVENPEQQLITKITL